MEKRFVLLVAALTLACGGGGGGGGKPSCGASDPCGAGYYCAHTPDGNVCWADKVPPVISLVSLTCSTIPCRRDAVLTLIAIVTDESAMGTVTAAIDGDAAHPRTLTHVSGNQYQLDLGPGDVPFPYFEHAIAATVSATDEAGNHAADAPVTPMLVTRMKWTRQVKGAGDTAFPLFSPAVLSDGTIVVAGSDGAVHFVSMANGGESRPAVSVGSVISSPPAAGSDAVWLATQDGKLHELRFDGTVVSLPANCSTTQQLVGPPAVSGQHAFVGSKAAVMITADAAGFCTPANAAGAVSSPPSVTATGKIIIATGSTLRSMSLPESGVLKDDWTGIAPAPAPATLPDNVNAAIAVDADGALWTIAQNGAVNRTSAAASTSTVTSLSGGSPGVIVLADNSVVLSDAAKRLVRARASGSAPWTTSDAFTGAPATGLALGGSVPTILVPTDQGRVYTVNQSDGHIQWSAELSGQSLEPANLWTDPGAATSTAYLAGADGNLYAIIVDGALDTSAPWPKAFHDPRNTSNAGVTP